MLSCILTDLGPQELAAGPGCALGQGPSRPKSTGAPGLCGYNSDLGSLEFLSFQCQCQDKKVGRWLTLPGSSLFEGSCV